MMKSVCCLLLLLLLFRQRGTKGFTATTATTNAALLSYRRRTMWIFSRAPDKKNSHHHQSRFDVSGSIHAASDDHWDQDAVDVDSKRRRGTTTGVPNDTLKDHFDAVMSKNSAPLFESYETYKASLPILKTATLVGDEDDDDPPTPLLKLVDVPFFAREEDLRGTMDGLEYRTSRVRSMIRYAVSPAGGGKTACILPAFLQSTAGSDEDDDDFPEEKKYSHYLYLSFANNGGREFSVSDARDISDYDIEAAAQGAAFMVECLRRLLNCEFGSVPVPDDEEVFDPFFEVSITNKCQQLLDSNLERGRILVHVDEHRKMTENPHFRRGALSVVSRLLDMRADVVVTDVEVPAEVSSDEYLGANRYMVPVPVLDANAALRYAGCDDGDIPEGLDGEQKRFLANLKFRIAAYLSTKMPEFHVAYSIPDVADNNASPVESPTEIQDVIRVYRECVRNVDKSIDPSSYLEAGLMERFMELTRYGAPEDDSQEMEEKV